MNIHVAWWVSYTFYCQPTSTIWNNFMKHTSYSLHVRKLIGCSFESNKFKISSFKPWIHWLCCKTVTLGPFKSTAYKFNQVPTHIQIHNSKLLYLSSKNAKHLLKCEFLLLFLYNCTFLVPSLDQTKQAMWRRHLGLWETGLSILTIFWDRLLN